jgi:hypothetical protein
MPVAKKFCEIQNVKGLWTYQELFRESIHEFDINAAHKILVNGIRWYNTNKQLKK